MAFHCCSVAQEAFKTPNYTTVYMDVWSQDELESCRAAMWPQMPQSEMVERYDRYDLLPVHCVVGHIGEDCHLQTALLA